jgi:hypothetical protein
MAHHKRVFKIQHFHLITEGMMLIILDEEGFIKAIKPGMVDEGEILITAKSNDDVIFQEGGYQTASLLKYGGALATPY